MSNPLYKTALCRNFAREGGRCPYGRKCQFAHGAEELRARAAAPRTFDARAWLTASPTIATPEQLRPPIC